MTGQNTKLWSRQRPHSRFLGALVVALGVGLAGCRTGSDDIERWANTAQGPRKLVAVLTHDKYPMELRLEAAMTLIRMKPRGGRRIGIQGTDEQPGLIGALQQMDPANRSAIVAQLVPALTTEIVKAPPPAQAGQAPPADVSTPYKDAAFALLVTDGGSLVSDVKLQQDLRTALATWASTNFAERMDDSSQLFGMEQVLRELKADGVRKLPDLMLPGAAKVDRMADLVADFGDPATKLRASQKLVTIAQQTASEEWIKQKAPAVEQANKASKLNPKPEQFRAQLEQYQEEELLRVFASMKRVGGQPSVDFLLGFAQNKANSDKKRANALAALQGNLDRNNPAHANGVLAIASAADTPDQVRDVALQRVGEFPRATVVERLYGLFDNENWKVRWVAAELILRMSDTGQLPEFFDKIGKAPGMAITEPLRYGALIADMKGPKTPKDAVQPYLGSARPVEARLTALGYYYAAGTPDDLGQLSSFADDKTRTPECKKDVKECEWKCEVTAGDKQETKDITTLGEFFEFCVKPVVSKRQAGKKAP